MNTANLSKKNCAVLHRPLKFLRTPKPASTMSACRLPNLDLSSTFGVVFWGFMISTLLLGVSLVQGYIYYANNCDGWFMRVFVFVLLALDVTGTLLVTDSLHYYLIRSFGNPFALLVMTNTFVGEFIISVVVILLSQLFYASRIYTVRMHNHGRFVAFIIVIFAVFTFGAGIAETVELFAIDRVIANLARPRIMITVGTFDISSVVCDVVTTISMCCFMSSRQSSFKQTKALLNKLFFFSVNRGFLVCVTQTVGLVIYLTWPSATYWMPFHLTLSKLHVNTLLAMLNSRSTLRSQLEGHVNYIDRSSSKTPDHYPSPMGLRNATDSGKREGNFKTVNKFPPLTPHRLMQSEMQTSRSFITCDEVHEHGGIEFIDIVKGPSIANHPLEEGYDFSG